jgi:four helix bundle protein
MADKITSYQDLLVWQKGMELVEIVYKITEALPSKETYGLTSQIRRSAISIPSNIAEGCKRRSTKDFIQFLKIAMGSCAELETQPILAKRLYKIDTDIALGQLTEIQKMISTLIKKLLTIN